MESIGLLPDTYNCGLRMHRECRERFFSRHCGLVIPAWITARAWPLSDKKPVDFLSDSGHVRAMMHTGIANCQFPLKSMAGKMFPVHAQPGNLRIWQETHWNT